MEAKSQYIVKRAKQKFYLSGKLTDESFRLYTWDNENSEEQMAGYLAGVLVMQQLFNIGTDIEVKPYQHPSDTRSYADLLDIVKKKYLVDTPMDDNPTKQLTTVYITTMPYIIIKFKHITEEFVTWLSTAIDDFTDKKDLFELTRSDPV